MLIDGKYQNKIEKWGLSQYGWRDSYGFHYYSLSCESLRHNLQNMKNKLEGYIQDIVLKPITNTQPSANNINFYNNNKNSINNYLTNIDFNSIEQKIKECESLTDSETKEILVKLKEMQKIYESDDSRKNKWEKAKKILIWLADKSVEVGIAFLSIIMSSCNQS